MGLEFPLIKILKAFFLSGKAYNCGILDIQALNICRRMKGHLSLPLYGPHFPNPYWWFAWSISYWGRCVNISHCIMNLFLFLFSLISHFALSILKLVNTYKCKIYSILLMNWLTDFPGGSDGKASVYNVGDLGSIPGSGWCPGEGNGNPLQFYYLENPTDRGA